MSGLLNDFLTVYVVEKYRMLPFIGKVPFFAQEDYFLKKRFKLVRFIFYIRRLPQTLHFPLISTGVFQNTIAK